MTRQQRTLFTTYRRVADAYWTKPSPQLANELDQAEDAIMSAFLGTTERVHNQRYQALRAAFIIAGEVGPMTSDDHA
jgi:hypothetical protein